MNLFEKIQAVSQAVMNIEKDMVVGSGKYSYKAVSDQAVLLAVKKAEVENKILSIPVKQELLNSEIIKLQEGDKERLLHVDNIKMTVRIIDIEKPESFIEVESFGKGIDNSDKGLGKASTYARKYALLNAYKIATGEDPDAEKSQETTAPKTIDDKRKAVEEYCMKNNDIMNNVLQHFALGKLDDLSKDDVEKVYKQFTAKKYI